jgi:hypothetical protein
LGVFVPRDLTAELLARQIPGTQQLFEMRIQPEDSSGELPPPSNRGVTVTTPSPYAVAWAGIHWFSGTTNNDAYTVLDAVSGLRMGAPVVKHPHGAKGGYFHSASCSGVTVAWGDTRPDVLVTVPGEVCEELGISGLVALSILTGLEPTSRIDVAWDADCLVPEMFAEAFEAGNVVTRIQRPLNPDTGRVKGIERHFNHEGDTVYLGSRTSERFLRVYDRRGPTRVELELKERRAVELWRRLIALNDEAAWGREALSELRAFIDFRERSEGVHVDRCELLPWWDEFCSGADRRSTVIPRKAPDLESQEAWLRGQVAGSLALLVALRGQRFLDELLRNGQAKNASRPDRLALIAAAYLESLQEAAD